MKKTVLIFSVMMVLACGVNAERVVYESSMIWSAGAENADYSFESDGTRINGRLTDEGWVSVPAGSVEEGVFKSRTVDVEDTVTAVTVNYAAEGTVTVSVSTDDGRTWLPAINGVPLKEELEGMSIAWKAVLEPGGCLKRLTLDYETVRGLRTGFGAPLLSGSTLRKRIDLVSTAPEPLFNHQVMIRVAADESAASYDVQLDAKAMAGFDDLRFTAADGRTLIPHTVERIDVDESVAYVWVRVPQISPDGTSVYVYYANDSARPADDPRAVFDFYDSQLIVSDAEIANAAEIRLDGAVIEYKARPVEGKEIRLSLRGRDENGREREITLYSSDHDGSEHCIARDGVVGANSAVPLLPAIDYGYRVELAGNAAFTRFDADFVDEEALSMLDVPRIVSGTLVFKAAAGVRTAFDWIRVRRYTLYEVHPAADTVYEAETVRPAVFDGTVMDQRGRVVPEDGASRCVYALSAELPDAVTRLASVETSGIGTSALILMQGADSHPVDSGQRVFLPASAEPVPVSLKVELDRGTVGSSLERAGFEYLPGVVTLIAPNGGERLSAGGGYAIRWSADDYLPDDRFVLDYSPDNGKTWREIADTANSGSFEWMVPAEIAEKALLGIRLAGHADIGDVSDGAFGITDEKDTVGADRRVRPLPEAQNPQTMSSTQDSLTSNEVSALRDALASYRQTVLMPGERVYDVVLYIGDGEESTGFKDGDIVTLRPAGQRWSDLEQERFIIIQMYLKESEARQLTRSKQASALRGEEPVTTAQRMYRVPASRLNLPGGKLSGLTDAQKRQLKAMIKDTVFSKTLVEKK